MTLRSTAACAPGGPPRPAEQLSQKTCTFARMITALVEEAEAIGWYEQRLSLEKDAAARAIMKDAQRGVQTFFNGP
jgi:hypothetical protein